MPHISDIIWYLSFSIWLTSFSMIISRSIHVAANGIILFFFYGWVVFHGWYVYVCTTSSLFIYLSVEGHVGCFHVFTHSNLIPTSTPSRLSLPGSPQSLLVTQVDSQWTSSAPLFSNTLPPSLFPGPSLPLSVFSLGHWRCSGLFPPFSLQMLPSDLIQAQGFNCLQALAPSSQCPRLRLACQHPIRLAWWCLTDGLKMSEQNSWPSPANLVSPDSLISAQVHPLPGNHTCHVLLPPQAVRGWKAERLHPQHVFRHLDFACPVAVTLTRATSTCHLLTAAHVSCPCDSLATLLSSQNASYVLTWFPSVLVTVLAAPFILNAFLTCP